VDYKAAKELGTADIPPQVRTLKERLDLERNKKSKGDEMASDLKDLHDYFKQ